MLSTPALALPILVVSVMGGEYVFTLLNQLNKLVQVILLSSMPEVCRSLSFLLVQEFNHHSRGPQDGLSCCISASNIRCTVSCPICYDVNLSVSYKTIFGQLENANYTQDFGTDNNTASAFYTQHLVNSTSACHYNPHHLSQVRHYFLHF